MTRTTTRAALAGFAAAAALLAAAPGGPAWGQKQKGKGAGEKGGQKHVFSGPAPAHPFDLILARPTDRAVTVSVLAYADTAARISYGTAAGNLDQQTAARDLKAGEPAEFVLSGLRPDTRYFYRVHTRGPGGTFAPDEERTFHTQRPPGARFAFTLQADSHLDQASRPAVYERTLANALADRPDFHIDLGDTFMTEKYERFRDARPQYLAQRYYLGRLCHSAALFLVLGNHDGERLDRYDGTPECMPVWACRLRKSLFPNPVPDGFYTGNGAEVGHVGRPENYYAWEWGGALFVALDPFWTSRKGGGNRGDGNWGMTLGKDQYDWLAKTLAGSKARFKFVFLHHLVGGLDSNRGGSEAAPYYEWGGKGKDGTDEFAARRPGWATPVHRLLVKHNVSAVFHGHDHFYAHQELDDVKYVMVPQPGHPGADRLRNADEYGYIRGDFLPPAGHLRVTVSAETATVEYVRSYLPQSETATRKNGQVAHSFTIKP